MNAARGWKKVDRMAAVITEFVSQRKALRDQMQSMMPMMMQHMQSGMMNGMMKGLSESMSGFPMMKKETAPAEGHQHQH